MAVAFKDVASGFIPAGIRARGRNGNFKLNEVSVSVFGSDANVAIYSSRFGDMPPIVLCGPKADVAAVLKQTLALLEEAERKDKENA